MTEDIKLLRKSVNIQTCCVALQSLVFIAVIWLIVKKSNDDKPAQTPPISMEQTANPEIVNNLSNPSEAIEARGERQGYYTKAQFAQLMGFSVRTLERRIADNLLHPPVVITESGEVRIDLDATLTRP